jgi:hypothetical protein
MFANEGSNVPVHELRQRIARLAHAERDIRERVDSRSGRAPPDVVNARDPVQDRLLWLLAKLGAQRRAAERQLRLLVGRAPLPVRDSATGTMPASVSA